MLEENGGVFISIENGAERNIRFRLQEQLFQFDPNRIFSEEGRINTLQSFKNYSPAAAVELKKFSQFLLNIIPDSAIVMALHNNTNNEYSIQDYKNSDLKKDAASIHINASMDADDFVYTSDSNFFQQLKGQDVNAVLQNNTDVTDDGSLSVFFGKKSRSYVNIEAEYGHLEEQANMIRAMVRIINSKGIPNPQR